MGCAVGVSVSHDAVPGTEQTRGFCPKAKPVARRFDDNRYAAPERGGNSVVVINIVRPPAQPLALVWAGKENDEHRLGLGKGLCQALLVKARATSEGVELVPVLDQGNISAIDRSRREVWSETLLKSNTIIVEKSAVMRR